MRLFVKICVVAAVVLAAVVGIGQTKYTTKRTDVSIAGLVREAAVNSSYARLLEQLGFADRAALGGSP